MIKYANGEKDVIDNIEENEQSTSNDFVQATGGIAQPDGNNQYVISNYNNYSAKFIIDGKPKKRKAKYWAGILAVDTSSVISSSLLEVSLIQSKSCLLNGAWSHPWPFNGHYYIQLKNKSLQTLYVDLGNTFRIDENNQYKVYYDTKQTTITHNSGSGMGLNVGSATNVLGIGGAVGTIANGVIIGGGRSHSSSTTYSKQRVVAIPPQATMILEKCEWEHVKGAALYKVENCVYKSYCEGFNYKRLKFLIHDNEIQEFSVYNSPCKYTYTITYSQYENFSQWQALNITVYARLLCGGVKIYNLNIEKIDKKVSNYTPTTIIIGGETSFL